jgi:hypothetical protein
VAVPAAELEFGLIENLSFHDAPFPLVPERPAPLR